MLTCIICGDDTALDDVQILGGAGRCICLRCYSRETGRELEVPRTLRRAVMRAMAEAESI